MMEEDDGGMRRSGSLVTLHGACNKGASWGRSVWLIQWWLTLVDVDSKGVSRCSL